MRAIPVLCVLLVAACSGSTGTALPTASPSPTATVTPTASPTPSPTPSPSARPTASRTPSPTPSPTASYRWSSRRVTAADLPHSWHAGCPVAPSQLRLLTLPYRDFGGARRTGRSW
ncbi:MAG TPA: hypothetical protein VL281_12845 [Mycobacteriales bacterium]|nr:hypothetical protein [Mycobacteriales bacterium]